MSIAPQDLEQVVVETASQTLRDVLFAMIGKINAIDDRVTPLTESTGTLAEQPTLSTGDSGFIYNVTDYSHRVRWDGSVWGWAPGDPGNDYIALMRGVPQGNGWQLCDGTATTFLAIGGASLTTTAFTTPNLNGTPSYPKLGSAYAAIAAATAPGISGSTANEAAHTHTGGTVSGGTATEAAHTHPVDPPDTTSGGAVGLTVQAGSGAELNAAGAHTHQVNIASFTSGVGSSHSHGTGTLTVGTSGVGSAHLHGVGTLVVDAAGEPSRVTLLPYYRR